MVLTLSFVSIFASIRESINSAKKIRDLAFQDDEVMVYRQINGEGLDETISSLDLVPGDLVYITPEEKVPCDIILLEGTCIVNEGILTGESTPIKKTAYEPSTNIISANILLSGTICKMSKGLKMNSYAMGIVASTGFYTFKGGLVRGIINQETEEFRFHKDSFNYLKITFGITFLGLLWYFYYMIRYSLV